MEDIKDYSLITELNFFGTNLTILPDLSRYINLKKIKCTETQITSLDNLPKSLIDLNYYNNPFTYNFDPTLENIRNFNKSRGK